MRGLINSYLLKTRLESYQGPSLTRKLRFVKSQYRVLLRSVLTELLLDPFDYRWIFRGNY